MRMLAIAAVAAVTTSSAAYAQAQPVAPASPSVAVHTTSVHTHTVTHHDGRRHPLVREVVHRSTVATPNGTARKTTLSTRKSTPQ